MDSTTQLVHPMEFAETLNQASRLGFLVPQRPAPPPPNQTRSDVPPVPPPRRKRNLAAAAKHPERFAVAEQPTLTLVSASLSVRDASVPPPRPPKPAASAVGAAPPRPPKPAPPRPPKPAASAVAQNSSAASAERPTVRMTRQQRDLLAQQISESTYDLNFCLRAINFLSPFVAKLESQIEQMLDQSFPGTERQIQDRLDSLEQQRSALNYHLGKAVYLRKLISLKTTRFQQHA